MRARCARAPPAQRVASMLAAVCAWLVLAAPAARGDAGAAAPAVAVATAAELAAAVNGGAVHIVVTDHLDLSDLPIFGEFGFQTTDDDLFRANFYLRDSELASIRVRRSQHQAQL